MKFIKIFLTLPLLLLIACNQYVPYNSESITIMGRTQLNQDSAAAELFWSGASVMVKFKGTGISVDLLDSGHENYYNVFVDDSLAFILRPDTIKSRYVLASDLPNGEHEVELFRRTESSRGKTYFYGFELEGMGKLLPADEPKDNFIEFYGNSITCAYGNEDYSGNDSPDSIYTNNYLSYAAITARHFDAEYSCIARSGIGIMVSWFNQIMPELYYRLDESDSLSMWDFSQKPADVVVVNLLQNDSWIVNLSDHVEFKRRFGDQRPSDSEYELAYAGFIGKLRGHYPDAYIVCILGNMDITREGSQWPDLVSRSVAGLNDDKVLTHYVPYKNSPGHPKVEEQFLIAESLIEFLENNINW